MRTRPLLFGVVVAAVAFVQPLHAESLSDLFAQVPAPPADAMTAVHWMDGGNMVAPPYLEFQQKIADERSAILTLNGGEAPNAHEAYAPSPQASPEVQRLARAYNGYLGSASGKDAPVATLTKRTRWVKKAMTGRQIAVTQKLRPCPDPCQDGAAIEHNRPLLQQRQKDLVTEMEMWSAMFADWKRKRAPVVASAQQSLDANAAAADSPEGRAIVARYRAAMLNEISLLFSITDTAVRRAVAVDHGLDGTEPDSISGATRKAGKS